MSANMQQISQQTGAASTEQEDAQKLFLKELESQLRELEQDSDEQYKYIEESAKKTASAVLFRTPEQDLLLVKPKYASGAFGNCSVWIGSKDRKLYIRKIVVDDIEETTRQPPIEREIELTVDHPNVPQIVYSVNHEGGPNPTEFGYDFEGKQTRNAWSIVSNFVNGPTLEQLTNQYIERGERFPEWAVWQCGLTLLEILRKMQFRNIVHSDIRSRNTLVSTTTDDDKSPDIKYHLIDFGIAQIVNVIVGNKYRDGSMIAEVLFCMMLNKPHAGGHKVCKQLYDEVQLAAQQENWPYSQSLVAAAWAIHVFEVTESEPYGIAIPKGRMRTWLKLFTEALASSKTKAVESGDGQMLRVELPIRNPRPLLVRNFLPLTNSGAPACCPFRRAEINAETFEILTVGQVDTWGEHFADVCWKSDLVEVKSTQSSKRRASDAGSQLDSDLPKAKRSKS